MIHTTQPPNIWKSDLILTDHINLSIPGNILTTCNYLRSNTNNNEFSILCKGSWTGNTYILATDYVIPIQNVDRTSVYYDDENLHIHRSNGFNVVIHCHPFPSKSFSHTDNSTINAHFDCSILYSEGSFTTAIIPIKLNNDTTLQLTPKHIEITWTSPIDFTIDEINELITPVNRPPIYNYLTKDELSKLIDIDGCVIYIDNQGDVQTIPYDKLPPTAVYSVDDEAFIEETCQ